MFYNLSKLLLSFLSILFAINLNASNQNYAGLKKGFLSSSKSHRHEIVSVKHDTFDDEDSLWSKCCNKDMRKVLYEKIYALCSNDLSFVHLEAKIKSIEHNFTLLDQGSYEPYKSKDFFINFLFLYDIFFTQLASVIDGLNDKPQIEPFMMQALGSKLIKGKFNYMDSLPSAEQIIYKNDFISSTSSKESGEFKYYKESALLFGIIEPFRYIQQTLASKENIYIIYNQSIENNYTKIVTINNNMHYVKGVISYRDTIGSNIFLHNNGAIIYNNSIIEEDGFILIKGWVFAEDYSLFYYARHPFLQERFFFEIEKFSPDHISPIIKAMLASIGGISQVDNKKFIFIPQHHDNMSLIEIDMLLKILYEMKTYLPKEDIVLQLPWINETIDNLSTVLAENISVSEQSLDEVLPDNYRYDYAEHYHYAAQKKNKIVKDKSNKDKDIAKILNDIEQKYYQYTAKKRSFNDRELRDLLGDMMSDFNEVGISSSSEISTRGSHVANKGVSLRGWETNFSLAKRSSKIYRVGTVRTIIKDWVDRARSIAAPHKS